MPALDVLEGDRAGDLIGQLFEGLNSGYVGVCLCDNGDFVRYANAAFRAAFFPDLPDTPVEFVDAIAEAIMAGKGIKLTSMPIETFIPRVKDRRRSGSPRYDFTVDLTDGSWWSVSDYRLQDGWMLVIATEISAIKQEEFRLRDAHAAAVKAASTDFLTGLPNRRSGIEHAEAALEDFRASRLPLTIAVLDVDHFKSINDSFGHDVGDAVLVHLARMLGAELGPRDHISRIGGEEFLIVMPATSASRAEQKLQRVIRRLRPMNRSIGKHPVSYGFSAGLASAETAEDLKSLLSRADAALYAAKLDGRRRVAINEDVSSSAA